MPLLPGQDVHQHWKLCQSFAPPPLDESTTSSADVSQIDEEEDIEDKKELDDATKKIEGANLSAAIKYSRGNFSICQKVCRDSSF